MDDRRQSQLVLVSEYIKFHIGLYVATPPVLAVVAEGLAVNQSFFAVLGISAMITIYLGAGASAALFMGEFVNKPWGPDDRRLEKLELQAFGLRRRIVQHWLYWLGLILGVLGIFISLLEKSL